MVVVCSKRMSVLFALLFFSLASFLNAEEGRFTISDSIAFLTEGVEVFPRRGAPDRLQHLEKMRFLLFWENLKKAFWNLLLQRLGLVKAEL